MQSQHSISNVDPAWELAKKRASFKRGLVSYLAVNAFLVGIWFYTTSFTGRAVHFWPIWPMLGWGLGLVFNYLAAYQNNNWFSVEKEYEKLKQQQP
ncbi:MAG: 2TM domain-containing protein [Chitinophagaceae bacterium]